MVTEPTVTTLEGTERWLTETNIDVNGFHVVNLKCIDSTNEKCFNSVSIYLFGATVTSWIHNGKEKLFLSETCDWSGIKSIRGGIPIVFPQFGRPNTSMLQHGLVRDQQWGLVHCLENQDSAVAVFTISSSDASKQLWNHDFKLTYHVTLTKTSLICTLEILNSGLGQDMFSCHSLLHTYLALPADISQLSIAGLADIPFNDKVSGLVNVVDVSDELTIGGECDRVYTALHPEHVPDIVLKSDGVVFAEVVKHAHLKGGMDTIALPVDVVVWNPWNEKNQQMRDLHPGAFRQYVCVEPGIVSNWVQLECNASLTLTQQLNGL